MIEMLRLCPGDNMSQRTWLGSALIRVGRYADALFFAQIWLHPFAQDKGGIPPRGGTAFQPPGNDQMTVEREKTLSEWGCGAQLYTAALASFRLFGDCPQSQQYLRIAARANPHVLIKILGQRSRPGSVFVYICHFCTYTVSI
jgi:hypothetical protein